jgi:hypothetical protein
MAIGVTPPGWEKQGSAEWLPCPACQKWFPVDPQLVAAPRIDLVCPACAHAFRPPGK